MQDREEAIMQKYRRTTHAILLVVGLLMISGLAAAEDFAKVGTVGSNFLKIPIGARGVAMGNAFAALSDDHTAMFWNPAGLVHAKKRTVMAERINWLADISYDAISFSYPVNSIWTVGFFGTSMNSGDIERTTVEQPNGTGENFSVGNLSTGITLAMNLTDRFSFGANIKYIREDLDEEISSSYAVDVGTMYDTRWNTVRIAMSIRNFGPEIELDGGYNDYDNGTLLDAQTDFLPYHYPMTFRLGVALDPILTDVQRLTVVGELEHPNDNVERLNFGSEYAFREMFFLRGGYTFNHDTMGLSAGVGFKWTALAVDYAFTNFGILDDVHRFGFSFSF
jgi:long-subunit fatty acid transport protein